MVQEGSMQKIERALISVSDKSHLLWLVKELQRLGIDVIATDGTASLLAKEHIQVQSVSEATGFPEILGGRLKTLHPIILGGLLGRTDNADDLLEMKERNIKPIGLLICNLYPFSETVKRSDISLEEAIEQIDIGGPTMIRSAAKNYKDVGVVIDPTDYQAIVKEIRDQNGTLSLETRKRLAIKVFNHTRHYEEAIYDYLTSTEKEPDEFPQNLNVELEKINDLRYGENPHQKAAVYSFPTYTGLSLVHSRQVQGKALSYNNYGDLNAALCLVNEFTTPAAAIIKHGNPCGCAIGNSIRQAYQQAYECDPISAYGGIIGLNRT